VKVKSPQSARYIADCLDEGVGIDVITTDFSKAVDVVSHDRLLTELAPSSVGSRVIAWVREYFVGCTLRVRVRGQVSEVRAGGQVSEGKSRRATIRG
jgi:hypothetical protein